MKIVSVRLTDKQYAKLRELVLSGKYLTISEAIRDLINRLIE